METSKSFQAKLARICEVTNARGDTALAKILKIKPPSVAAARKRQQIPTGWIETIAEQYNISADWLFFGRGEKSPQGTATLTHAGDTELVMVPMVEARLSAGSGSLQVDGDVERSYAFRADFLRRKGNPKQMVMMRVEGDSMQPEIMHNDVVLLDKSKQDIRQGRIFAVGFDDAIYLKRIDQLPGKIILKSANSDYPPVELDVRGQNEDAFRVIGQVIWCGREYR